MIGPNGAGKTTLINLLTGVLQPTEGRITLLGEDITNVAPNRRVKRGMVRTFQINQLFDTLTPLQTLALTVSQQQGLGTSWWKPLGKNALVVERCEKLLEQFHLTEVMNQQTRVLAYGKRRLLEIAIALACEPKVLLPCTSRSERIMWGYLRRLLSCPYTAMPRSQAKAWASITRSLSASTFLHCALPPSAHQANSRAMDRCRSTAG